MRFSKRSVKENLSGNLASICKRSFSISALISDLKASTHLRNLEKGKLLHAKAIAYGAECNLYVVNTLLDMYCKCGCISEAEKLFNGLPRRNTVSWNALLQGYVFEGESGKALEVFLRMQKDMTCSPDARTFVSALKACSLHAARCSAVRAEGKLVKLEALEIGMSLHRQAAECGCLSDMYISNTLVDMYTRCGSVLDARLVFDQMESHDVVSWNSLMLCYAENNESNVVLELLQRMSCTADGRTYSIALKACSALATATDESIEADTLQKGMALHAAIATSGVGLHDIFVSTCLIEMYSRCKTLTDARLTFDRMPVHDVVCWTSLVLAYVENGEPDLGLKIFHRMNLRPTAPAFVAALKACSCLAGEEESQSISGQLVKLDSLEKVMNIHRKAASAGCMDDFLLQSSLSDVYGKCGSMLDARVVFDRMANRDIVLWNTLLAGYAENQEEELVLELFDHLKRELAPNEVSYLAALKACTGLHDVTKVELFEKVADLHLQAVESGYLSDMLLASTLAGAYAELGCPENARRVFDSMHSRDAVTWTRVMLGYVSSGENRLALDLFEEMVVSQAGEPSVSSYVAALKACTGLAAGEDGKPVHGQVDEMVKLETLKIVMKIHSRAARQGCELDMNLSSSLVSSYSKCGCIHDARRAFDRADSHSVISWTALLMAYSENGEELAALELFDTMKLRPNTITYVAAFKACASLATKEIGKEIGEKLVKLDSLEKGVSIHSRAEKGGCILDLQVSNVLIDMYGKCGSLADARKVFDRMEAHSLVSWTAILMSCAENSEGELALKLFRLVKNKYGESCIDVPVYVAALKACETRANLKGAKVLHGEIHRRGLEDDHILDTCLVDVYGKCGGLDGAQRAFDLVKGGSPRLVTWNALMAGYTRHGEAEKVVKLFDSIVEEGLQPDGVTFICVLTAFSHAGMVERGNYCFTEMSSRYGVSRRMEHYTCMVDMLSRANQLECALKMVEKMPFQASVVTWTAVMGACCRWKNLETGRLAFQELRKLDERDGASYLLMSKLYGSLGMWEEQSRILTMRSNYKG